MVPTRWMAVLTLAAALGAGAMRAETRPAPADWRFVLAEALEASGVEDPAERLAHAARFEAIVAEVSHRVLRARSERRRAKKLHELVHARWLRRYKQEADGLAAVLERGEFNCVSATMFEGLLAEAVGLRAQVVAGPRHVFLRVEASGRMVDVETTAPSGFDVRRDPVSVIRFLRAYRLATEEELGSRGPWSVFDEYQGLEAPVPMRTAVAFVWHTRGERLLAQGRGEDAAHAFLEVHRLHPELARRSEALRAGLARAFHAAYEDGRFDESFRIAAIDLAVAPGRTTAQDRLLAAAIKRVHREVDSDDSAGAEVVLDEVTAVAPEVAARFDREACPIVATAAVRTGAIARALRMAERYAAVEPDGVAAQGLASWVERRLAGVSSATAWIEADPSPRASRAGAAKIQ